MKYSELNTSKKKIIWKDIDFLIKSLSLFSNVYYAENRGGRNGGTDEEECHVTCVISRLWGRAYTHVKTNGNYQSMSKQVQDYIIVGVYQKPYVPVHQTQSQNLRFRCIKALYSFRRLLQKSVTIEGRCKTWTTPALQAKTRRGLMRQRSHGAIKAASLPTCLHPPAVSWEFLPQCPSLQLDQLLQDKNLTMKMLLSALSLCLLAAVHGSNVCYDCHSGGVKDYQHTECPVDGQINDWAVNNKVECEGPCVTGVRRWVK